VFPAVLGRIGLMSASQAQLAVDMTKVTGTKMQANDVAPVLQFSAQGYTFGGVVRALQEPRHET
jgi:hypothetical protein